MLYVIAFLILMLILMALGQYKVMVVTRQLMMRLLLVKTTSYQGYLAHTKQLVVLAYIQLFTLLMLRLLKKHLGFTGLIPMASVTARLNAPPPKPNAVALISMS